MESLFLSGSSSCDNSVQGDQVTVQCYVAVAIASHNENQGPVFISYIHTKIICDKVDVYT